MQSNECNVMNAKQYMKCDKCNVKKVISTNLSLVICYKYNVINVIWDVKSNNTMRYNGINIK